MYIYTYIHIYICTYIHVYMCTYIHINIYRKRYACVHVYIYIYTDLLICLCVYMHNQSNSVHNDVDMEGKRLDGLPLTIVGT